VEGEGWLPAKELQQGDLVRLQSGKSVPVENTELVVLGKPILVYNFRVADYHTYFVSSQQVLVHNNCGEKRPKIQFHKPDRYNGKSGFAAMRARWKTGVKAGASPQYKIKKFATNHRWRYHVHINIGRRR